MKKKKITIIIWLILFIPSKMFPCSGGQIVDYVFSAPITVWYYSHSNSQMEAVNRTGNSLVLCGLNFCDFEAWMNIGYAPNTVLSDTYCYVSSKSYSSFVVRYGGSATHYFLNFPVSSRVFGSLSYFYPGCRCCFY